LREVDRIIAHRFGAELGDGEVGRKAMGNSTGLNVMRYGRTRTRRSRRKLHLGVEAVTGQIVAASLTSKEVDDAAKVGPLLDQVAMPWRRSPLTVPMTKIVST
jgi:hypothetical protein